MWRPPSREGSRRGSMRGSPQHKTHAVLSPSSPAGTSKLSAHAESKGQCGEGRMRAEQAMAHTGRVTRGPAGRGHEASHGPHFCTMLPTEAGVATAQNHMAHTAQSPCCQSSGVGSTQPSMDSARAASPEATAQR